MANGERPPTRGVGPVPDLHELRKFRHFFRDAYVLELDPLRVREHAERLLRVHPAVRTTLTGFRTFLDDLLSTASRA